MSEKHVTTFKIAPARTGKTFITVRQIVDEWLPKTQLEIWSNLPLKRVKIARYCEEKYGMNRHDTLKRLHRIPRQVLKSWKHYQKVPFQEIGELSEHFVSHGRGKEKFVYDGPWLFFAQKQISNSLIVIDEVHNFCGAAHPKQQRVAWSQWLGELGHNQCHFICISQNENKVEDEIKNEAASLFHISNTGLDRDPLFKIELYDWMELAQAFLFMRQKLFVFEQEIRTVEGKKVPGERRPYLMCQPYFTFYDSFNAPIIGNKAEGVQKYETKWEKTKRLHPGFVNPRIRILLWFIGKNLNRIAWKVGAIIMVIAIIALFFSGAAPQMMFNTMTSVTAKKSAPSAQSATANLSAPSYSPKQVTPTTSPNAQVVPGKSPEMAEAEKKMAELQKSLDVEKMKLAAAEAERKRLESIAIITPDSVTLHNGFTYKVGEVIPRGDLSGMRVEKIDWTKREAVLTDEKTNKSLTLNLFN